MEPVGEPCLTVMDESSSSHLTIDGITGIAHRLLHPIEHDGHPRLRLTTAATDTTVLMVRQVPVRIGGFPIQSSTVPFPCSRDNRPYASDHRHPIIAGRDQTCHLLHNDQPTKGWPIPSRQPHGSHGARAWSEHGARKSLMYRQRRFPVHRHSQPIHRDEHSLVRITPRQQTGMHQLMDEHGNGCRERQTQYPDQQ